MMNRCILFLSLILVFVNVLNTEGKICVATEENRYLCTDDAAKANAYRNQQFDLDLSGLGVEQTVTGSREETDKVEEVIRKMEEYFIQEVFAKPEYKSVRDKW
jgi:hypothetical protein